ncbi:chaperone modulator CbpM [Diaphorobacter sp.]|uniref:chaperone modulator CbpM n=1 Tax=Diaphorobacter sp. TaxID=1934310 RepID=UPI0028AE4490|nr:chaperone modulator CbpM [Diaphorobacter sp.]
MATTSNHHHSAAQALAELLDENTRLTLDDLARACAMAPGWVSARVSEGLIQGEQSGGAWHFSSTTVIRARRMARLESTFEADPQLAALTTDLMEEVTDLKLRLRQLEATLRSR